VVSLAIWTASLAREGEGSSPADNRNAVGEGRRVVA